MGAREKFTHAKQHNLRTSQSVAASRLPIDRGKLKKNSPSDSHAVRNIIVRYHGTDAFFFDELFAGLSSREAAHNAIVAQMELADDTSVGMPLNEGIIPDLVKKQTVENEMDMT